MNLFCPSCNEPFDLNLSNAQSPHETECRQCQMQIRVRWKIQVELVGPVSRETEINPSGDTLQKANNGTEINAPTVLLAVDGDASRGAIRDILEKAGLSVIEAMNGREALELLQKNPPAVTLLDVELPQVLGFQVCEIIKKSPLLKNVGVILVASIYDKTRYKREPKNLYGADDYIERHQINDDLLGKIKKILNRQGIPWGEDSKGFQKTSQGNPPEIPMPDANANASEPLANDSPVDSMETSEIPSPEFNDEMTVAESSMNTVSSPPKSHNIPPSGSTASGELSPQHSEAKRFARIIISDIALYNQKSVEEGLRKGNLTELLKNEIEEGRKLYQERVSNEIQNSTNYFDEAIQEFISKRTQAVK